jgi:hypothetical protein
MSYVGSGEQSAMRRSAYLLRNATRDLSRSSYHPVTRWRSARRHRSAYLGLIPVGRSTGRTRPKARARFPKGRGSHNNNNNNNNNTPTAPPSLARQRVDRRQLAAPWQRTARRQRTRYGVLRARALHCTVRPEKLSVATSPHRLWQLHPVFCHPTWMAVHPRLDQCLGPRAFLMFSSIDPA